MALPQKSRLPLRFERGRLNKTGFRKQSQFFTLILGKSPVSTDLPRFAILVSKKISPLATERNRVRRLTSEIIKESLTYISTADYLVIPKKNVLYASYEDVKMDFSTLINDKSGI